MATVLYVQTHGEDEPSKAAAPFYLATTAAAMDMDVSIYFTMDGPTLLRRGTAEALEESVPGLAAYVDQARSLGVRFLTCQPSLAGNDLALEDLVDGVEVIGGAAFNEMAVHADAVLSF
jgi:predicted peroxiredoxin